MASPKTLELRARETALKMRAKGYYRAQGVGEQPDQLVLKAHVDQKWRDQLATHERMRKAEQLGGAFKRASEKLASAAAEPTADGRKLLITAGAGVDRAALIEQLKERIAAGEVVVLPEGSL